LFSGNIYCSSLCGFGFKWSLLRAGIQQKCSTLTSLGFSRHVSLITKSRDSVKHPFHGEMECRFGVTDAELPELMQGYFNNTQIAHDPESLQL